MGRLAARRTEDRMSAVTRFLGPTPLPPGVKPYHVWLLRIGGAGDDDRVPLSRCRSWPRRGSTSGTPTSAACATARPASRRVEAHPAPRDVWRGWRVREGDGNERPVAPKRTRRVRAGGSARNERRALLTGGRRASSRATHAASAPVASLSALWGRVTEACDRRRPRPPMTRRVERRDDARASCGFGGTK